MKEKKKMPEEVVIRIKKDLLDFLSQRLFPLHR